MLCVQGCLGTADRAAVLGHSCVDCRRELHARRQHRYSFIVHVRLATLGQATPRASALRRHVPTISCRYCTKEGVSRRGPTLSTPLKAKKGRPFVSVGARHAVLSCRALIVKQQPSADCVGASLIARARRGWHVANARPRPPAFPPRRAPRPGTPARCSRPWSRTWRARGRRPPLVTMRPPAAAPKKKREPHTDTQRVRNESQDPGATRDGPPADAPLPNGPQPLHTRRRWGCGRCRHPIRCRRHPIGGPHRPPIGHRHGRGFAHDNVPPPGRVVVDRL